MSSGKKIVSGVIWTMLFNIVNALYGFISVPILISYFGKMEYGLIGLALSINVYLRLMDMGFDSTNVRFFSAWIAEKKNEKVRKAFQTSIGFYGFIGLTNALVLFILAFFSNSIFNVTSDQDIVLKHLILILCFTTLLHWLISSLEQLVKATENVAYVQRLHLLSKILLIIVLFITVYNHLSIEVYFILSCLTTIAVVPFCISKIRKEIQNISFIPRIDWTIFKEMLPYSLNILSFSFFQFSFYNLRPFLLGIEGTVESVADYRILNGIIGVITMMSGAFLGTLLPSTSRIVAEHDKDSFYRLAYSGTSFVSIVVCYFCFVLMTTGPSLISIYVGKDYLYLIPWLNLWLLCTLGNHNQAISSLILAESDIRAISYSSIVASVIGLLVTWFTIPNYLVGGTVLGFVAYMLVQMVFYYCYYWTRCMGINSVRVLSKCFLPFLLIGVVCYWILSYVPSLEKDWIDLILKGMAFTVMYVSLAWLLLTDSDRYLLRKIIKM